MTFVGHAASGPTGKLAQEDVYFFFFFCALYVLSMCGWCWTGRPLAEFVFWNAVACVHLYFVGLFWRARLVVAKTIYFSFGCSSVVFCLLFCAGRGYGIVRREFFVSAGDLILRLCVGTTGGPRNLLIYGSLGSLVDLPYDVCVVKVF